MAPRGQCCGGQPGRGSCGKGLSACNTSKLVTPMWRLWPSFRRRKVCTRHCLSMSPQRMLADPRDGSTPKMLGEVPAIAPVRSTCKTLLMVRMKIPTLGSGTKRGWSAPHADSPCPLPTPGKSQAKLQRPCKARNLARRVRAGELTQEQADKLQADSEQTRSAESHAQIHAPPCPAHEGNVAMPANVSHARAKFLDELAASTGGGNEHVELPVVGRPKGPGRWSVEWAQASSNNLARGQQFAGSCSADTWWRRRDHLFRTSSALCSQGLMFFLRALVTT